MKEPFRLILNRTNIVEFLPKRRASENIQIPDSGVEEEQLKNYIEKLLARNNITPPSDSK